MSKPLHTINGFGAVKFLPLFGFSAFLVEPFLAFSAFLVGPPAVGTLGLRSIYVCAVVTH